MIAGAHEESRWVRPEPRRAIAESLAERIARTAFPGCRVKHAQPLADGLRNANFKLQLDSPAECVVLRIYEHDRSLCQKEADIIRLASGSVPIPEVIHAEPLGWEDVPPFALFRHVEGITFRELKNSGDRDATAEGAFAVGQTLAAIGQNRFPRPGWVGPGPEVTAPLVEGADAAPRFVDLCLACTHMQQRMPAELRDRTHELVWKWAQRLGQQEGEARLVHGDFGKRNLLMREVAGKWRVAAVLDWEYAVSGTPLADVGHFLCYEREARPMLEPHFSRGFVEGGGALPQDWRQVARLVDLTGLCESLTRDDLPDEIAKELVELVHATVEDCEPQLP